MIKLLIIVVIIFCCGVFYGLHSDNTVTNKIDYYGKQTINVEKKIINNNGINNYYQEFKQKFL